MLHRAPTRLPRHVLLGGTCALMFLLCLTFCIFYLCYAPNADVVLLSGVAALVFLWPLTVLSLRIFGENIIQVEHAGVVSEFRCFGARLSRRGWTAAQILHFDWERTPDGVFALRLLLLRSDARSVFFTVLHTDSPYALAAIWRDLELHYPGSGLRTERPLGEVSSGCGSRWFCLLLLLSGVAGVVCLRQPLSRPVMAVALGQVTPAVVQGVDWTNSKSPGSSYHLIMRPNGSSEPVRTATSFSSHAGRVPGINCRLPILWTEKLPYCYLPGEVFSFLVPIPVLGTCILLIWLGAWGLMRSARYPR